MKTVHISNSIILSQTVSSIHVMKMVSSICDNRHEVILLTSSSYKEYEQNIKNIFEFYNVKKNLCLGQKGFKMALFRLLRFLKLTS